KTLLLLFTLNAAADDHETSSPLADYLNDNYTVDERIIIGGQPSAQVLESLQPNGVGTVINFRSRSEVEGLSFDQPGLLSDAGVSYHEIGISRGEDGYSPEKLEEFNALMEAAGTDQVLLHCGSGYRASQMYAAWLVKYHGVSPDEALERVSPSGWWPMPMEQLLGQPLSISVEEG
ncbi:MAG: sulfur transferase domain-containing protein, partial [Pseudomonadota bacterium]